MTRWADSQGQTLSSGRKMTAFLPVIGLLEERKTTPNVGDKKRRLTPQLYERFSVPLKNPFGFVAHCCSLFTCCPLSPVYEKPKRLVRTG